MPQACFLDPKSGSTYSLDEPIWCSPDGRPLSVSELPGIDRSEIEASNRSIWRYRKSLPVDFTDPVSLGEGCTPLVPTEIDGFRARLKLEWFAPTGSFKDRGTSIMMTFLRHQGIRAVVEDSSGNAGASVAAYGAAAGMDVSILAPSYTQSSKIVQARAYGARVRLVDGTRDDVANAAIKASRHTFYASHNWHPMFLQGTKSLGYEIWEDLQFDVPNNIVIPASEGSLILGCHIAFHELSRRGEIERFPRLFVSQPENCAPLHHALNGETRKNFKPTIAEGTAVQTPKRLSMVVAAIRETGGGSITVSESEILNACNTLSRAGFFVEPSCAHAWVGARKLAAKGTIKASDRTVVVLTGTGLKARDVYENAQEAR